MPVVDKVLVILTHDRDLVQRAGAAMPGTRIVAAHCLEGLAGADPLQEIRLMIDPDAVCARCLQELQGWGEAWRRVWSGAVRGPTSAADRAHLPHSPRPGRQRCHQEMGGNAAARATREASAWDRRKEIMGHQGYDPTLRRFLLAALENDHEECTVAWVAAEVGCGVRALSRLTRQATGHPPRVILALVRVMSVARELDRTSAPLSEIARRHGFPDRASMDRLFKRFVGSRPCLYRARARWGTEESRPDSR
jgi:AraC-like DNA-binding protein